MDERVARSEQVARGCVKKKQAKNAHKNSIWAKRAAVCKLIILGLGLLIAGGTLIAVMTIFDANSG
jgi:hypothetical protein